MYSACTVHVVHVSLLCKSNVAQTRNQCTTQVAYRALFAILHSPQRMYGAAIWSVTRREEGLQWGEQK